ncbi:hypothetical protein [Streptomyces incanus]|uniref:Uncharacterized protein n=1 Tax=Streptomyces incanus TaxID=887453 RepID=A0ABW0XQQ7_9ACTN
MTERDPRQEIAILEGADHEPPPVLPFLAPSDETAACVRPDLASTGWHPWYPG